MCFIMLPEAFGFFWGMFTDSVSIFGKRGHIVLASVLQIAFSFFLLILDLEDSIWVFIFAAFAVMMAKSWMTPAIDTLMVI